MTGALIKPMAEGGVRGSLHLPAAANGDGITLAHGAGSNADAPLLKSLADEFAGCGLTVLRLDLPFRQLRPHGPPGPGDAARDREGLRKAVHNLRGIISGRIFLGGHSYGGRQSTILAAEDPALADALLLLSYPLHPPRRKTELRTSHFPQLRTPALFVHGTRDPFGSVEELREALKLIPARTELLPLDGKGHDLKGTAGIAGAFRRFIS